MIRSVTASWQTFLHHSAYLLGVGVTHVTLTTWPANERWQFDGSGMMVRLAGCRWHYERDIAAIGRRLFPGRESGDVRLCLLAVEFPGVAFDLPSPLQARAQAAVAAGVAAARRNGFNVGPASLVTVTPPG